MQRNELLKENEKENKVLLDCQLNLLGTQIKMCKFGLGFTVGLASYILNAIYKQQSQQQSPDVIVIGFFIAAIWMAYTYYTTLVHARTEIYILKTLGGYETKKKPKLKVEVKEEKEENEVKDEKKETEKPE